MTKRQFSLLLALAGQAGCIVYDDALRREPSDDAARDVMRDAALSPSRDGAEASRPDAPSDPALISDGLGEMGRVDVATIDAMEDIIDASRTDGGARDAFVPPPDVHATDTTIADAMFDARADTVESDAFDAKSSDAPSTDMTGDPPIVGCTADFTVSGVTWDGGATEDSGARVVRLVGDNGALGAWSPEVGPAMSEKAPGAWSVTVALPDKIAIEFKFVKVQSALPPEWEQWLPFDSNRSMSVDCGAEGGTTWIDAATEAGPASRAVGRSYGGAFGVRPLDATK
jgi:hypothetical protein